MANPILVNTWRGNYRANIQKVATALREGAGLASRVPVGGSPFYFDPTGAPTTMADALSTFNAWVTQALAQQSTGQVYVPPMDARRESVSDRDLNLDRGAGEGVTLPVSLPGKPQ